MSEVKHTPGPWFIEESRTNQGFYYVGQGSEFGVTNTIVMVTLGRGREKLANARLIAAAPELLTICQQIADWDTERNFLGAPHKAIVEKAKEVIAKATQS